jgi:phage terminase large subunit-like protein
VRAKYGGTTLGRQELHAEISDQRGRAVVARMLDGSVATTPGGLRRIVVAVDPPAGSKETSDACGIVAVGLAEDGGGACDRRCHRRGGKARAWAARAVALYERWAPT